MKVSNNLLFRKKTCFLYAIIKSFQNFPRFIIFICFFILIHYFLSFFFFFVLAETLDFSAWWLYLLTLLLYWMSIFIHMKNLWISLSRTIYSNTVSNLFDLRKYILWRNKQDDFNTLFYQYIVIAFRVYRTVKYPNSLLFIDSIAFIVNKRPNLRLINWLYKSLSYYQPRIKAA